MSAKQGRWLPGYVGLAFAYPALAAAAVQFWLLPRVFPQWHWGHGLLRGGDWIDFHQTAIEMASRMQFAGWSAWELRPSGYAPAGIAAALYHLFTPEPWVLIPVNAAVHAVSVLLLVLILETFCRDRRLAILGSLPFLFFPTSMLWTTQMHKDGWMALGMLALVYGWLRLVEDPDEEGTTVSEEPDQDPGGTRRWTPPSHRELATGLSLVLLGGIVIWVIRPHFVAVTLAVGVAVSLCLTVLLHRRSAARGSGEAPRFEGGRLGALVAGLLLVAWAPTAILWALDHDPTDSVARSTEVMTTEWSSTPLMPRFVDERLRQLAELRAEYLAEYPGAGSNVDPTIELIDATDVIAYVPRAAQVGLFAPFPSHWGAEGSSPETTVMRRIAALEVTWFYVSFVAVLPLVYRWRRRPGLWIVLAFTLPVIVVLSFGLPNLGTLHRVRYGSWMLLGSLGFLDLLRRLDAVERLGWRTGE